MSFKFVTDESKYQSETCRDWGEWEAERNSTYKVNYLIAPMFNTGLWNHNGPVLCNQIKITFWRYFDCVLEFATQDEAVATQGTGLGQVYLISQETPWVK